MSRWGGCVSPATSLCRAQAMGPEASSGVLRSLEGGNLPPPEEPEVLF
jgi:hypothetical protein